MPRASSSARASARGAASCATSRAAGAPRLAGRRHVAFAPFASRSPFEIWVVPRRHEAGLRADDRDGRPGDRRGAPAGPRRLAAGLDGPPYNLVLHTAPLREQVDATYHWHWEIHPRLREIAGLELGTGLPVNPVSPEDAVEELLGPRRRRPGARGDGGIGLMARNAEGGAASHTADASSLAPRARKPNRALSDMLTPRRSHARRAQRRTRHRPGNGGPSRRERAWDRDVAGPFVEELFAKHHGEIYAYLVRMVRDPELAADLTQDAFVKAYKAYDSLEKPENARAWLYQIAHRVALDHIRRQKIVRFFPWTGESRGAVPSAEHLVMDAHISGDLQRALERMPERQRAALLLAELHDLTGLELAAALGVSHVAARALLTRARESLRQALAAERAAEAERGVAATSEDRR